MAAGIGIMGVSITAMAAHAAGDDHVEPLKTDSGGGSGGSTEEPPFGMGSSTFAALSAAGQYVITALAIRVDRVAASRTRQAHPAPKHDTKPRADRRQIAPAVADRYRFSGPSRGT
jgi:hypothetical protein